MKILKLRDQKKIQGLTIRNAKISDVKYCKGTDQATSSEVELYTFKYNYGFYFCLKQGDQFGRFIEVTPNFYETLHSLEEREFPEEFNLEIFKLIDF